MFIHIYYCSRLGAEKKWWEDILVNASFILLCLFYAYITYQREEITELVFFVIVGLMVLLGIYNAYKSYVSKKKGVQSD